MPVLLITASVDCSVLDWAALLLVTTARVDCSVLDWAALLLLTTTRVDCSMLDWAALLACCDTLQIAEPFCSQNTTRMPKPGCARGTLGTTVKVTRAKAYW